jgi:Host cell surface-exposed lipoprotein
VVSSLGFVTGLTKRVTTYLAVMYCRIWEDKEFIMSDAKEAQAEAKAAKAKAKALRPWFKKKRVWLLGVVVVAVIGTAVSGGESSSNTSSDAARTEETTATSGESENQGSDETSAPVPDAPKETPGQANARKSAESYLRFQAFSRTGLIKQLEFEKYSKADATYAVDAVDADWNEQASKSAKSYLESQSFSRQGLIDQLLFEGFTQAQAEYGVGTTGL